MRAVRPRHATLAAALFAATLTARAAAPEKMTGKPETASAAPAAPACIRCGATCGLEAICVCSPGTKKIPKVEYEVDCEPICMPGCGSTPWSFGRREPAGCSSCTVEQPACPGRVRTRKLLRKETTEEEICVVERRVEYLCGPCSGRTPATCCGSDRKPRPATWWERLTAWWP